MGDGWSLWIGSAVVAVTQRRGGGGFCCMLQPVGPAGGHIGDQSAPLQQCHCRVWSYPAHHPSTIHANIACF